VSAGEAGPPERRTVHAAGAVLWREADPVGDDPSGLEVAVVHRPHHRDWSLPKGKFDPGETRADAAVREIAEETGFAAVLGRHLRTVRYPVNGDDKVVEYWSARAGEGAFSPGDETDELRWLHPAEAAGLLSYESDRAVLDDFTALPARLRTVLLVRHGAAGRRVDWHGPDAQRPLVPEGHEQAERLAALLARFGVETLHAVDKARCRQTLEPFAAASGLRITSADAFADGVVARDPDAALDCLTQIATGPSTAAVCAQGDGIPTLVRALADAAGDREVPSNRDLSDPPCRKGSVWVLSVDADGRLAAADYYRDAAF
jgi:8-oxo-(d)GTP phosphatase